MRTSTIRLHFYQVTEDLTPNWGSLETENLAMVNEPLAKWRCHRGSWTWANGYLLADEKAAMLERYKKTIPNFSEFFAKEMQIMEMQIMADRAKHLWKSGNARAARKCLGPII